MGKKKTPKGGKRKASRPAASHDEIYNEIDDFNNQKDKISFNQKEDDSDDIDALDRNQEVMTLPDIDDDDDSDSDDGGFGQEQDSEDEEEVAEKRKRAIQDEENISKAWGKRKGAYYGADTQEFELMDDEEEETLKGEEEEGRRLQLEQADDYDEEDMTLTDVLDDIVTAEEGKKAKKGKKKESKKKKKKKKGGDMELLAAMNKDLNEVALGDEMVEKIERDASGLTGKEKQEMLLTDAPELLLLLEDLGPSLKDLEKNVLPVIERVKEGLLATQKGISFFEVKNHLMLSYCINICFYLLLKAEGKQVKDHPVIKQLTTTRVMLDKMRSIDSKLKYQVDKLLKQATSGDTGSKKNPLTHKPNPTRLVAKGEDGGEDEADDGVYRAARLTSVEFVANEKATMKERKEKEKARSKAAKSSVVAQLRADVFADQPEERMNIGDMKPDKELEEREQFEEENFMRLMETKADKKKRKKAQKIKVNEDFDDFGDLTALTESKMDDALGGAYSNKKPSKVKELLEKARQAKAATSYFDNFDSDDEAAGEAMFQESTSRRAAKKQKKETDYPKPSYDYGEVDPTAIEEGSRREAGGQILKNRGLTRSRPRDKKNPRVRHRKAYDKALVKRRSQVQDHKVLEGSYGGEKSGLKTHLVRSQPLNK